MKIGICNETFGDWEFEKVCRFVANLGYQGIEIAPFTCAPLVTDLDSTERKRLRKTAEEAGLEVIGLHWLLAKTNGFHLTDPDVETRNRTRDYLIELGRFCADLGGKILVFGSPPQRNLTEGQDSEQAFQNAAQVFRGCVPEFERLGVILCMEPLSPVETNFIMTAEDGRRLVDTIGSQSFKLHLDVKAMASEKQPIPEIIRASKGYVRHFHANDPNLRGPGMGDMDFGPILQALRDIGYDEWLSVEVFDLKPGAETLAGNSIEYLRSFIVQ